MANQCLALILLVESYLQNTIFDPFTYFSYRNNFDRNSLEHFEFDNTIFTRKYCKLYRYYMYFRKSLILQLIFLKILE